MAAAAPLLVMCAILSARADDIADCNTDNKSGMVKTDPAKVIFACQRLADGGSAYGQFQLGVIYVNGYGISEDDTVATEWFRKAGNQGYLEAQYVLGVLYEIGHPIKDYDAAMMWFRKAADQGSAKVEIEVGSIYQNGLGVKQDGTEALRWYERAADHGSTDAMIRLSGMYHGKDMPTAIGWLRKAADLGNSNAMFELGYLYWLGGPDQPLDCPSSYYWFEKAAAAGHPLAKDYIKPGGSVLCHWTPQSLEKDGMFAYSEGDYATALRVLQPFANEGDANAQAIVGAMYFAGQGVQQDIVAALALFRGAANGKIAFGQYSLGVMYETGTGVPQDYVQAHMWFNLAAAAGYADAAKRREALAVKMTPTQMEKAQALAAVWKPTGSQ